MPSYSNIVSAPLAAANVAGATKLYATPDLLPQSGVPIGDIAYVISSKKLMVWNSGWYSIAIVNSDPLISTNLDPFTSFETDGTPIVLTLEATDPEGIPLVWSYTITSGSLGTTATVTQVDNVFTITPSTDLADDGEFEVTFSVTDGVATSTLVSTFRLSFRTRWNYGTTPLGYSDNIPLGTTTQYGKGISTDGIHIIVGAPSWQTNTGKAYIVDIDTQSILRELVNPSTATNTYFGYSVTISGDYCAVGAYGTSSSSGAVYIYEVATGTLVHTLLNPNDYGTTATDLFGLSISMDGDILAVGAYGEDGPTTNSNSGRVYVYSISSGTLIHTLDNPNIASTTSDDNLGVNVVVSGNYIAAYAHEDITGAGTNNGVLYVFDATTGTLLYNITAPAQYQATSAFFALAFDIDAESDRIVCSNDTGNNWVHVFELSTGTHLRTHIKPSAVGTTNNWGRALALDGYNIVIVDTTNSTTNAVWVYSTEVDTTADFKDGYYCLYDISGTNSFLSGQLVQYAFMKKGVLLLTQVGLSYPRVYIHKDINVLKSSYILNPNPYGTAVSDKFGSDLAMSGDIAVISAYQEDDAGGLNSGKAYIFNVATKTLLHTLSNPNAYSTSASDEFGYSVAINGNYVAVGAPLEEGLAGSFVGNVYVFDVTTGALLYTLDNPNAYGTAVDDRFGFDVAISGKYLVTSAPYEDDAIGGSTGKAYIFDLTTGTLIHTLVNPNPYGTTTSDEFGNAVAIFGEYVAVAARQEDDAGGTQSGKVYMFNALTGALLYTLDNPTPIGTSSNDFFGHSVAISGKYLVVGAYGENTYSGTVHVYDVRDGTKLYSFINPNTYSTVNSDEFGAHVSVDGHFAAVTARYEDTAAGLNNGSLYIYDLRTGSLVGKIPNPTSVNVQDSVLTMPVAISNEYILTGHPQGNYNLINGDVQSGFVRVWEASA